VALLVEQFGNLGIGVTIEKCIATGDGLGRGLTELPCREGQRSFNAGGLPTAQAHVDVDGVGLVNGDIFDEQSDHALSLPLWSRRICPQGGEVARKGTNLRLVLVAQRGSCCVARPVVLVLRVGELAQRVVPVRFQGVGHQSVVGVDAEVAPAGCLSLVAGPLDLAAPQHVSLIGAGLDLGLDTDGDLESDGADGLEHQLAHRVVDGRTGNA